jgi:competence protein ComEC
LSFTAEDGLSVSKGGQVNNLEQKFLGADNTLGSRTTASLVPFDVKVNGVSIDNANEDYPVLLYKDITYFPMTWRFAVTEFGWKTNWSDTDGFEIVIEGGDEKTVEVAEDLSIHFIDVGQGDSLYVEYKDFDMLIDAGDKAYGDDVVSYLKEQEVDDIEMFVISHSHSDHMGGADEVLEAFDVEKVIDSGQVADTVAYSDYWEAVENENCEIIYDDDMIFNIDSDLTIELMETGDGYKNTNDNSVIVKVIYKNVSALFTGDAEHDAEDKLRNRDVDVDIYKAAHHASSTSNTLLDLITPKYIGISVGESNTYGHPDPDILTEMLKYTNNIYATMENGSFIIKTDGTNITTDAGAINSTEPINNDDSTAAGPGELKITELDKSNEFIVIANQSDMDVELTGYTIVSVTGNQRFTFPIFVLKANTSVKVGDTAKNGDVDFHWLDGRGTWNNSNSDPAELYDSNGNLVDTFMD